MSTSAAELLPGNLFSKDGDLCVTRIVSVHLWHCPNPSCFTSNFKYTMYQSGDGLINATISTSQRIGCVKESGSLFTGSTDEIFKGRRPTIAGKSFEAEVRTVCRRLCCLYATSAQIKQGRNLVTSGESDGAGRKHLL